MFKTQQFGGPQGFQPQQYGGTTSGYYPQQTDMTGMFSSMMPMIMMSVMLAILMPMMKGVTESAK